MDKRIEDKGSSFRSFNLSDFKKWMDNQHDAKSKPDMIGLAVESKVNLKKLVSRIEVQDDEDIEEVAKEFKKNGGTIVDVDGHNVLVEVDSGSFTIHRMYVKKKD